MAQFDLSWVGEYIPMNVQANDFLNEKLENDLYGIYYSVQFEGNAETYLLQAKKAPVKGQAEWGMIEMAKSGKSYRFKRVKREDGGSYGSSAKTPENGSKAFLKDVTDMPDRWLGRLLPYFDQQKLVNEGKITEHGRHYIETAMVLAEESLMLVDKVRGSQTAVPAQETKVDSLPAPASGIKNKLQTGFSEPEYTEEDMPA